MASFSHPYFRTPPQYRLRSRLLVPVIPEQKRQPEATLLANFEQVRPKILGALLDAVAVALRRLPSVELSCLPRMADFAVWATAAETGFGWSPGTFMNAYGENRESANEVALEASVISRPLFALIEDRDEWTGTATELLQALEANVTEQVKRQNSWPKNGRSMSGHLKRLAPNLRTSGWEVTTDRAAKQRIVVIRRIAPFASSTESPSQFASSPDPGRVTQNDANRCGFIPDDGRDANDANPGTQESDPDRAVTNLEEGEL